MNNVILSGYIARKEEVAVTTTGAKTIRFSLAVRRDGVKKDSGKQDTDFIMIRVFGNLADVIHKYKNVGDFIEVMGKMRVEKGNNDIYYTYVIADKVDFGPSVRNNVNDTYGAYDEEENYGFPGTGWEKL